MVELDQLLEELKNSSFFNFMIHGIIKKIPLDIKIIYV
jgi:hypothetical protein